MTLLDFLAPAIGIAASPFGVVPAILLLFTPTPRSNAAAFALAWFLGVAAGLVLAMAASDLVNAREAGRWAGPARVLAGGALLFLAARQWRGRARAEMPGWMAGVETSRPPQSFRLGLLLSFANPKVLLLAVAGGLSIADSHSPLMLTVLFAGVATACVAAPLIAHIVAGDRIMGPLQQLRGWLIRHNGAIVAIVLTVIGAKLMTAGLELLV